MACEDIKVSIIVCTRNRAQYLEAALDSISNISATYAWEALIVDNASTDDTANIIRKYQNICGNLRYLFCDRIGLGAARDFAWREARGEIVAFTDDDCYPKPNYVDAICAAFARHPEADCIGGRIELFDRDDVAVTIDEGTCVRRYPPYTFLAAGALQGANLAFRREALRISGGFDPELGAGTPFPCEDVDAVAALLWSGREVRFDPEPQVQHHHRRRVHDLPQLMAGYDRGRGAYYAKWILRPQARWLYLRQWLYPVARWHGRDQLPRLWRELRAAQDYLGRKRRPMFRFLLYVAVLATFMILLARLIAQGVVKRTRSL